GGMLRSDAGGEDVEEFARVGAIDAKGWRVRAFGKSVYASHRAVDCGAHARRAFPLDARGRASHRVEPGREAIAPALSVSSRRAAHEQEHKQDLSHRPPHATPSVAPWSKHATPVAAAD